MTTLNWRNAVVHAGSSMREIIEVIERGGQRIALVTDEAGHLIGTVTDGDVRRALIAGNDTDAPAESFMHRNPVTAGLDEDKASTLSRMQRTQILHMPLVDTAGMLVGLETLEHLLNPEQHSNAVFFMAGGFGKRLRPLTETVPKPLLNVGSKPILEIILEQFISSGFHRFYIATHYKGHMLEEHFGDGSRWQIQIDYVNEASPLGTAGALGLLPEGTITEPVIVMNGDLLTKVNFPALLQYHQEHNASATMCVREYDMQVPFGVVEVDDCAITRIIEKPVQKFFVNAGIYVLNPEVIAGIDGAAPIDMTTVLEDLIEKGERVVSFPLHEYWLDIGRIEDYESAQLARQESPGD